MRDLASIPTTDLLAADGERVGAVWQAYRRRGDRSTVRMRGYTIYLVVVVGVLYGLPIAFVAGSELPRLADAAAEAPVLAIGYVATACAYLVAQLVGRFWGPLIIPPFVLFVLASTDMSPDLFLRRIAVRRMLGVTALLGIPMSFVAFGLTSATHPGDTAVVSFASGLLLGSTAASAWLWGQAQSTIGNLTLSVGTTAYLALGFVAARADVVDVLPAFSLIGTDAAVVDTALWSGLTVQGAVALALGWVALGSIRSAQLPRLAQEAARASQAQVFIGTGTFHDALDLYRPAPRGLQRMLMRTDGRLHGYLRQGAIRAARTPWRAVVAAGCLVGGATMMASGILKSTQAGSSAASLAWTCGAVVVYLGSGWVSETCRGLRDELSLAPLLGEWWGGVLRRNLSWPFAAVLSAMVIGSVAALFLETVHGFSAASFDGQVLGLLAASTLLILATRFLREMKLQLPIELFAPMVTPFGDVSGLRVLAWQFDSLLLLVVGVALMGENPSSAISAAAAAAVSLWCAWKGLESVGWSPTSLIRRLRRT